MGIARICSGIRTLKMPPVYDLSVQRFCLGETTGIETALLEEYNNFVCFYHVLNYGGNMANIFRKSSLDKLSSPEQLDKAITIISPSFWIAAIGGGLIVVVALVWSIFGRLPVNVNANGIYMGKDGMHSVVAEADGIVQEIFVSEGDNVTVGQKIAQLDDEKYQDELETLIQRRDNVEAVSFYSYDDPATSDTKPLLDIKSQLDVAGTSLSADQIALRERYSALSKQRESASAAKSTMNSKKKKLKQKQSAYLKAQTKYENAKENLEAAQAAYEAALKKLAEAGVDPTVDLDSEDEDVQAYIATLTDEQLKLIADRDTCKEEYESADATFKAAEKNLKKLEFAIGNAESDYSKALQTYQSEQATLKSLKDTVSQLEAKVKGDSTGKSNQVSSLEEQFNASKGSILDQINQEIKKQKRAADAMTLTSRVNGKVSGLNIAEGNAVTQGTAICKINSTSSDGTGVICYVPVSEGRKVKTGMKVVVYPSTVNKQEYGHMEGTVVSVSDSVVSAEDMQNQLGDSSLVQSFQQNGAVVRVVCDLKEDPDTASGYAWSSKKGADVTIDEGTVISADIVTEDKAPITMLIPYLKNLFSVDSSQNTNNQQNSNQG